MPPAGGSARIVPWSLRRRRPPCGGRDRPPYIAAGNGRQQIHVRFPPVPPAGRCKHRPLRRGVTRHDCHPPAMPAAPWFRRPSALHCRAGVHARRERDGGENMAGLCKCRYAESCDTARRGGARQPGRVLVRQGAAPLSRLAPTAPLTGEPFKQQALYKASPARGGGCAARCRRRGALPVGDGNILQTLAGPCPRIRRGRCLHRPGSLAAAQAPRRRARSPALYCGRERVISHKRQPSASPAGEPMQASVPTQRGNTPQPSSTCHACRPLAPPPVCLALQGGRSRPPGRSAAGTRPAYANTVPQSL